MKLFKQTAIATTLIIGAFAMGSAQALTISAPGVNAADLRVNVSNGVATIFGTVDSGSERDLAEKFVAESDGVKRVINLVTYN